MVESCKGLTWSTGSEQDDHEELKSAKKLLRNLNLCAVFWTLMLNNFLNGCRCLLARCMPVVKNKILIFGAKMIVNAECVVMVSEQNGDLHASSKLWSCDIVSVIAWSWWSQWWLHDFCRLRSVCCTSLFLFLSHVCQALARVLAMQGTLHEGKTETTTSSFAISSIFGCLSRKLHSSVAVSGWLESKAKI